MAYKKIDTLEDKLKEKESAEEKKTSKQKPYIKEEQPDVECKECECEHCNCENNECEDNSNSLATEYLNMARVIQADFDNFRKRSAESVRQAKLDGIASAVEVILPALDVFKKAKQMIKEPNALKGIEMVEDEIYNSLKCLGVQKIDAVGKQFDPNFHHALTVMEDKTKPNNEILEEYQAGYILNDKVIKYSQVIVNKLKEEK